MGIKWRFETDKINRDDVKQIRSSKYEFVHVENALSRLGAYDYRDAYRAKVFGYFWIITYHSVRTVGIYLRSQKQTPSDEI